MGGNLPGGLLADGPEQIEDIVGKTSFSFAALGHHQMAQHPAAQEIGVFKGHAVSGAAEGQPGREGQRGHRLAGKILAVFNQTGAGGVGQSLPGSAVGRGRTGHKRVQTGGQMAKLVTEHGVIPLFWCQHGEKMPCTDFFVFMVARAAGIVNAKNNPISVIESQCLGTPVLGANIGGIPEVIEEYKNGLLFESGNSDDLKEKIELMYHMPFDYTKISQEALKKYSAENYYRELIKIYNE